MRRYLLLVLSIFLGSISFSSAQHHEANNPYIYYYAQDQNAFVVERADGSDRRILGDGLIPPPPEHESLFFYPLYLRLNLSKKDREDHPQCDFVLPLKGKPCCVDKSHWGTFSPPKSHGIGRDRARMSKVDLSGERGS